MDYHERQHQLRIRVLRLRKPTEAGTPFSFLRLPKVTAKSVRWALASTVAAGLTLFSLSPSIAQAAVTSSSVASTVEGDQTERTVMVIMAPAGPVFAEMKISVDAQPYRTWVTSFLAKRVDLNGDKQLTVEEIALIPERLLQQTPAKNAKSALRKSAGSKDAESVSTDDFNNWFASHLSRSFDLIAGSVQASEAVRLAALIDANGDGKVSREEVANGSYSLRFRDLDDDQTFSATELMPFRDPRNQQAAVVPDVANLPFVQLGDQDSIERTANQLISRYGDGTTITLEVLRQSVDQLAQFDSNGDSQFSVAELQTFLQRPTVHLDMNIQLADAANASDVAFEISEAASSFCKVEPLRRGRAKLVVDDMPIEVRSRGGSQGSRGFMVNFLLQRMASYDADKNGYLSEDEFPEMQQQMAQIEVTGSFADVDINGDAMLFRDEVKTYIERDAIATQSRIEVSVKQDGKTLFKLIDQNSDRRLSERELRNGFDALLEYDLNEDKFLTESELGTAYTLQIGLGQAASLRMDNMTSMGMGNRTADAILPGISGLEGPEWFRRMDRNQDRDVSFREFLGTRELFDQLDLNKDALLSADEAEKLEEQKN